MVNLNPNELKDGDCESPWIQEWGFRMRALMGFMMNVVRTALARRVRVGHACVVLVLVLVVRVYVAALVGPAPLVP
eukprot:341849-Prymnesium_polylepis.1